MRKNVHRFTILWKQVSMFVCHLNHSNKQRKKLNLSNLLVLKIATSFGFLIRLRNIVEQNKLSFGVYIKLYTYMQRMVNACLQLIIYRAHGMVVKYQLSLIGLYPFTTLLWYHFFIQTKWLCSYRNSLKATLWNTI